MSDDTESQNLVLLDVSDQVATVILNRLHRHNSLEHETASACRLLVGKNAGSLHKTKQLLSLSGLRERLQEERRIFVETVVKPETIESVEAFLHTSS